MSIIRKIVTIRKSGNTTTRTTRTTSGGKTKVTRTVTRKK